MRALLVLALGLAAVAAAPNTSGRIVGGSVTTIGTYPFTTAVLYDWFNTNTFLHKCGGALVTVRTVMTAAHCLENNPARRYRLRLGATNWNSGGASHNCASFLNHPNYRRATMDSDISLMRLSTAASLNNNVRVGSIPGANYNLADRASVRVVGWGHTSSGGVGSQQLRHVEVWVVNQATCRSRYSRLVHITDNMLCAGWLDVGGRDSCQGDSGGPLIHNNNVVVGVVSFGEGCGLANYPGVYVRVSRYTQWISSNS